jgi:hypothetical protein
MGTGGDSVNDTGAPAIDTHTINGSLPTLSVFIVAVVVAVPGKVTAIGASQTFRVVVTVTPVIDVPSAE